MCKDCTNKDLDLCLLCDIVVEANIQIRKCSCCGGDYEYDEGHSDPDICLDCLHQAIMESDIDTD